MRRNFNPDSGAREGVDSSAEQDSFGGHGLTPAAT